MENRKGHPYLIILTLWLMVFAASSQVIIVVPILPRIGEVFGVSESLLGLLGTSYALMLCVFALVAGPISDRIGRRAIILTGCLFMTLALALHGFADTFGLLLLMRSLAGIGAGFLSGSAISYVGDWFYYERRGWAAGWIMSGIAFGQIVGIPLGTVLADLYDFRAPFLAFAAVMGAACVLVWFCLPQPLLERDRGPLSVRRAMKRYGELLRDKVTAAAVVSYVFMFLGIGMYVYYLPLWLENDIGLTATNVASLFFVGGLANVVASPVAGRLSDSIGRKPILIVACVGLGLVMVLTTIFVVDLLTAYILFGAAMGLGAMRISPLQALMTALVTHDRRGILMSLSVAMGQLAFGLGSAVAGSTYVAYGYRNNTLWAAVAVFVMALVVWFALPEPGKAATTEK